MKCKIFCNFQKFSKKLVDFSNFTRFFPLFLRAYDILCKRCLSRLYIVPEFSLNVPFESGVHVPRRKNFDYPFLVESCDARVAVVNFYFVYRAVVSYFKQGF